MVETWSAIEWFWAMVAGNTVLSAVATYLILRFTTVVETKVTEGIKADVSGRLWNTQQMWTAKRDSYVDLVFIRQLALRRAIATGWVSLVTTFLHHV